jgi:ubiquinone/menaquinone biosynthesis C-methylase UbiE
MNKKDLSTGDQELYSRILASELYQAGDIASVFTIFKTAENRSSYETLIAGHHLTGKTVLDMPCGSGPLTQLIGKEVGPMGHVVGIDFNNEEIKKARESIKQENIQLLCEKAQNLSVPSHSIDTIFCHLGLMLFHPLEPVIETISRILKPGGFFVANLISSNGHSAVFQDYCTITHEYEQYIPKAQQFSWGDSRVNTIGGLQTLFTSDLGFADAIERVQYTVSHRDTPESMLKLLRTFFQINYLLEEKVRVKCEKELLVVLEKFKDDSGRVNFEIPFEIIIVRKKN